VTLGDLAKYSMTRNARGPSATAELLIGHVGISVWSCCVFVTNIVQISSSISE